MKFQPDSLPIRFLTKVCDLMILNFLFIFGCVTIVFSGAAVTALYAVTLRMIQGRAYTPFKDFLRGIWENFASSVPVVILFFTDVMLIAFLNTVLYAETLLISPTLFIALVIFAFVLTALLSWLFPLLAQFENTFPRHFSNAAKLALANLPITFLVVLVNLLPLLLTMLLPELFGHFIAFWVLIGFSTSAYLNSFYLNRVFKPKSEEVRASE